MLKREKKEYPKKVNVPEEIFDSYKLSGHGNNEVR